MVSAKISHEEDVLTSYKKRLSVRWPRRTVYFHPDSLKSQQRCRAGDAYDHKKLLSSHQQLPKAYAFEPGHQTEPVRVRDQEFLRFSEEGRQLRCWANTSMIFGARIAGIPWPVELLTPDLGMSLKHMTLDETR